MASGDSSTLCGDCQKPIDSEEAAVGCEGMCNLWFHKECTGISAGDYSALKKPRCSLIWMCKVCRQDILIYKNGKEELTAIRMELQEMRETIRYTISSEIQKAWKIGMEEKARASSSIETTVEECVEVIPPTRQNTKKVEQISEVKPEANTSETNNGMQSHEKHNEMERTTMIVREENMKSGRDGEMIEESGRHSGQFLPEDEAGVEGEWKQQRNRRRLKATKGGEVDQVQKKEKIRGTREGDGKLKAAESSVWIYVGRLDPETTKEDIQEYLLENGIAGRTSCTMVSNTDTSRAYKIGIPLREKDKVYDESFWPTNVTCRPFRAPWRYRAHRD